MKTPITYYGGKQKMADTIIRLMPEHKVYVEPFFGGGAVFFAKKPSYLEVINDINDNIVTFYRVCQDQRSFEELSARIQATLFSEALYLHAKAIWNRYQPASDIERAWAVWVVCNYSFNATPYGGWKWDMGTAGSHSGVVAANKRNAFTEELFNRLATVQISCRDALDVIRQRDEVGTFFYLDPPYVGADQKHYHGYGEKELDALLQLLQQLRGKFILSMFANDNMLDYAERCGWHVMVKDMACSVANLRIREGNKNTRRKQEYLVMNFVPSDLGETQGKLF